MIPIFCDNDPDMPLAQMREEEEMKELTDEEMNIAICEWRGWSVDDKIAYREGYCHVGPTGELVNRLPSYITDLNAMHEAEQELQGSKWTTYCCALADEVDAATRKEDMWMLIVSATARHRATALLRVVKPEIFK